MTASYLRSAIALLKRSSMSSKPKTLHEIRYTVQIHSDGSINASMLSQFTLCLTETPSGKHDIDVELAYETEDEKIGSGVDSFSLSRISRMKNTPVRRTLRANC